MHDGHRDEHALCLADAELRSALAQEIFVIVILAARQADAFQGGLDGAVAVSACGGAVAMGALIASTGGSYLAAFCLLLVSAVISGVIATTWRPTADSVFVMQLAGTK